MLVVITLLIALIPIFVHFVIFRTGVANSIPTFVLLGPSGSGKTSLCVWVRHTITEPKEGES